VSAKILRLPATRRDLGFRALDALEPLLLFAALIGVLVVASLGFGLTFDEVTYFRYADSVRAWWEAGAPLGAPELERYWAYDTYSNPHPPLLKALAAVVAPLAAGRLPFPTDYRLASLGWIAGCLTAAYLLLRTTWSRLLALTAVLLGALQPRVFGHLLIAATDSPAAMVWLLLPLIAWRLDADGGPRPAMLWAAYFALLGCGAAIKFTGLLAGLPMIAFFAWRRRWRDVALAVAAMIWALAFVVAASPHTWHRPVAGVLDYLLYPLSRESIPITTTYFGRLYTSDLPWHYFGVMTLVTFPLVLVPLLAGLLWARGEERRLVVPVSFALGFWLVLVHLPMTPRHDEVRQFLSVYPLLGIVAWAGLLGLLRQARRERPHWPRGRATAVACAVPVALLALVLLRTHPFELSYYNATIGGVRGAERRGMELSLYFEAIDRDCLDALERHLRPGDKLLVSPPWPPLLPEYARHGALRLPPIFLLPSDTTERPDWLLLVRRRNAFDDRQFVTLPGVYERRFDGVSMVKLVPYG
jgi:4-amino-4-deoxy-L-arabinose transferase-like glycosyltransferase